MHDLDTYIYIPIYIYIAFLFNVSIAFVRIVYKFYMNQPYKTRITACFTMYVVMMLGDIHLQDAAEVWMVAD